MKVPQPPPDKTSLLDEMDTYLLLFFCESPLKALRRGETHHAKPLLRLAYVSQRGTNSAAGKIVRTIECSDAAIWKSTAQAFNLGISRRYKKMATESLKVNVVNNPEKNRFEVDNNGQLSVLEYRLKADKIFLTHTEVPPELEKKGLGSNLAHAAMEYARRSHLQVVPVCPFIQHYLEVHPEYSSLLSGSESCD